MVSEYDNAMNPLMHYILILRFYINSRKRLTLLKSEVAKQTKLTLIYLFFSDNN